MRVLTQYDRYIQVMSDEVPIGKTETVHNKDLKNKVYCFRALCASLYMYFDCKQWDIYTISKQLKK